MGKFFGWLVGILASIIGGYILFYITRPLQIEGMVIDRSQNTAVEKALVTIEVNGSANAGPFDDSTDANGSYGMELSGLGWRKTVVVRAKAGGFEDSAPATLVIAPGGNRKDLFLTPISSPAPPPGVTPSTSRPIAMRPPAYVKKLSIQKFATRR